MLGQKKIDALRADWNESAARLFMDARLLTDAEAKGRAEGRAEQLVICAQEIRAANAEVD